MNIFERFFGFETKSAPVQRDEAYIDRMISAGDIGGYVSAVSACLSVISQGLALPPIYVQRTTDRGREYAIRHPLQNLIAQRPNATQTGYELREMMGRQAALWGNAYAWINRSRSGDILEIVPLERHECQQIEATTIGGAPTYLMAGRQVRSTDIWHFRGPAESRTRGINVHAEVTRAVNLTRAAESFGTDLFLNRAALEGIISLEDTARPEELASIRESFRQRNTGEGQRGRTAFFPARIKYQALSGTASDAQWIETRRYQIEEIARHFRVSPTKLFHTIGSQSYASVEQAHIAHDQDTDAHWHERFAQSATNSLLSDNDRRLGYSIVIDNRHYLRGTANERATYYNAGLTGGWMTQNEAREAEGYARSNDPEADKLKPAANLFGDATAKTEKP